MGDDEWGWQMHPPWCGVYDDVYDGYPTWEIMFRHKYINVKIHLVEPKKVYHPVVVTQDVMPLYRIMKDISWKQGFYLRSRVLTLNAITWLDIGLPIAKYDVRFRERMRNRERILTLNRILYSREERMFFNR